MKNLNRLEFIKRVGVLSSGLTVGTPFLSDKRNDQNQVEISQDKLNSISSRLSKNKAKHPSLHFDSKRLNQLRKQAKGTHQRYAKKLYEWVENNKSWTPPKITGDQGNEVELEESGAFLTNVSFAFCLSEKEEYLELARKWALVMCDYPEKAIKNYGIGIYAAGLARTFDWLYHDLAMEDRETIKTSVVDIVSQMYEDAQPGAKTPSWWAKAYIHHDFWIPMGGYGEAALALTGEIEEAEKYAAFAKANFDTALSWIGDDGAWHEGVADWCYAMAPMLWFYGAWESVTGENLHDTAWIKNTSTFRLYHWLPNNEYINLNDSFRSGRYSTSGSASCHLLRRFASLFKDGHVQWLAEKDEVFDFKPSPKGVYQAPYEGLSYRPDYHEYLHPISQTVTWNMLWYDPTVEPVAPSELPNAHHFENLGLVNMRTGWNKDDAVVSFSCAPLAGHVAANRLRGGAKIAPNSFYHDHADYNSFTLFANGQYFIIPPGYARRTSNFQNVANVNGADFSSDPSSSKLKITGFKNTNNFSYAIGDATESFLPQLGVGSFHRHILLFENKWLLIFDDLNLNEKGQSNYKFNRFSWTVHSDPNTHTFSIHEDRVMWKSNSSDSNPLTMYLIEPQDFGWECELFLSQKGQPMMEAIRLTKPEFYDDKKRVLSVWSWEEEAKAPIRMTNSKFKGVLLGKDKAVGFIGGTPQSIGASDFSDSVLKGREMYLFGVDTNNPTTYMKVKNNNISTIK